MIEVRLDGIKLAQSLCWLQAGSIEKTRMLYKAAAEVYHFHTTSTALKACGQGEHIEIPDIAKRKLADPSLELTIDQSLSCLHGIIKVGLKAAQKAQGEICVVVLGNTGAGTSPQLPPSLYVDKDAI